VFNVAEFARLTGQEFYTIWSQMKQGYCPWPRRNLSGVTKNLAYICWKNIVQRSTNPKTKAFKNYGGRGISLYPEWRVSFQLFIDHIGPRPSEHHFVDRIDNSKGYEPGNVRWATCKEQANNKRCRRKGGPGIKCCGRKFTFKYQGKLQSFHTWEEAAEAKDNIYGRGNW
jgi:hypothetical protein